MQRGLLFCDQSLITVLNMSEKTRELWIDATNTYPSLKVLVGKSTQLHCDGRG